MAINSAVEETMKEIARQTEDLLMDQLNELVSRGAIVVERGPMSLVEETVAPWSPAYDPRRPNRITIRSTVRLVLKDQEYIEKLEHRNKELENLLAIIQSIPMGKVCK